MLYLPQFHFFHLGLPNFPTVFDPFTHFFFKYLQNDSCSSELLCYSNLRFICIIIIMLSRTLLSFPYFLSLKKVANTTDDIPTTFSILFEKS